MRRHCRSEKRQPASASGGDPVPIYLACVYREVMSWLEGPGMLKVSIKKYTKSISIKEFKGTPFASSSSCLLVRMCRHRKYQNILLSFAMPSLVRDVKSVGEAAYIERIAT
jgi:hypothetical protein